MENFNTSSEQFKMRSDGFQEVRRKILRRIIPLFLIIGVCVVTVNLLNPSTEEKTLNIFPVYIPILFLFLGVSIFRLIKRQKFFFYSYRLDFDNNGITRTRYNTTTLFIPYSAISEIVKNANGSFTIKGDSVVSH